MEDEEGGESIQGGLRRIKPPVYPPLSTTAGRLQHDIIQRRLKDKDLSHTHSLPRSRLLIRYTTSNSSPQQPSSDEWRTFYSYTHIQRVEGVQAGRPVNTGLL